MPFWGMSQDTVISISPGMFDKIMDQQYLAATDGWLFKQGNDTAWAKTDMDVSGWKKLNPNELSAKYADKNGRVECWFRIKIKLNKNFGDESFGFKSGTWAACDLYIDGALAASFGSTGSHGNHFHEFHPFDNIPVPANLKAGNEYTLALHVVDYVAPFPPSRLRSKDIGLFRLLVITGPKYNAQLLRNRKVSVIFNAVWISTCILLCLFFWLLFIQNHFEKNLYLIAVGSTFFALGIFALCSTDDYVDVSYATYMYFNIVSILFISLAFIMALLILVNIFNRAVSIGLKVFIGAFFSGANLSFTFLQGSIGGAVAGCLLLLLFAVCIYYIVSSWKNLRGAQWAVVFGLCSSLVFIVLYIISFVAFTNHNMFFYYLLITGYALSFPLSLLVYVAMRFKEIIKEVQRNAVQVMQLSEEKKHEALNRQKVLEEEVNRQTAKIRTTLDHLKATQTQLIQSEKMASLGELTAGIAHEIQNPLNFVNNFSEVNKEMLEELKAESEKPKAERDEALETGLINDLIQNEQKINHHGNRAAAIVKGMLEHSRTSTGQKELTDINALADEYLRLSYHGLRAKEKNFNAEMMTKFDADLPKVKVIPQDIGRALLNLFNNAFYAVNQKTKTAGDNYKPEVSVTTSTENGQIIIKVKDNGVGIPDTIKDKIMQPFFTTKPTGEGTGLGLSLTYDMVVKGHGGSIQVNSVEGEGSEFTIHLPLKTNSQ